MGFACDTLPCISPPHPTPSSPGTWQGAWVPDLRISRMGEGRGHWSSQGWMGSLQELAVLLSLSSFWGLLLKMV